MKSETSQSHISTVPQWCWDSTAGKHRFGLVWFGLANWTMCKDDKVKTALGKGKKHVSPKSFLTF